MDGWMDFIYLIRFDKCTDEHFITQNASSVLNFCELQSNKFLFLSFPFKLNSQPRYFHVFDTFYKFHIFNVREEESDSHHRPGAYIL